MRREAVIDLKTLERLVLREFFDAANGNDSSVFDGDRARTRLTWIHRDNVFGLEDGSRTCLGLTLAAESEGNDRQGEKPRSANYPPMNRINQPPPEVQR